MIDGSFRKFGLPRGATGLSAVCDCGISWSYSITIFKRDHFCRDKSESGRQQNAIFQNGPFNWKVWILQLDFELKKVLLPPLGNFADISYLEENFKPHLLRDVCTLCSGALVSDSLLHMLLKQTKEKIKMKVWATERRH